MAGFFADISRVVLRPSLVLLTAVTFSSLSYPAAARGPDGIADVAEKVIDAVVNISTSQTIEARQGTGPMPQLPPGANSPYEEFFEEFFKRGGPNGNQKT